MNVSLEVKELGDRLGKYTIKWTYTLGVLVVIWLISVVAGCILAVPIVAIFEIDTDSVGTLFIGLFALSAAVAAVISVIVVWYMTGRRITTHKHGVHAHTHLGDKVFRWEDLDGIRTDITEAVDTHSPSYSTGSSSNSLVEVLLEIIFAIAASSLSERYTATKTREHYRLYAGGEEVLKLGVNYKDVSQLIRSLEEHITEAHVPRLLERWQQGEIVEVAHFSFEPDLIRRLGVTVKWADIQEITSFGGKITCILKNSKRVDLSGPSAGEINQHMVTPLLKAVHRASQA